MIKTKFFKKYSPISLIISFLLGITFVVLTQFIVGDLTNITIGERPEYTYYGRRAPKTLPINEKLEDAAYDKYETNILMPYKTKALVIGAIIYIPLFVWALKLNQTKSKKKDYTKLVKATFLGATAFSMFIFLMELASYMFRINERLAIYGISFALITVFIVSLTKIQNK